MSTKKPINKEIKSLQKKEERLKTNSAFAKERLTNIDKNGKSGSSSNNNYFSTTAVNQLTQRNNNDQPITTRRNGTNNKEINKSLTNTNNNSNKDNANPKMIYKKGKCASVVNAKNYLTERATNPNPQLSNRLEQSLQRMTEQNKLREEKKMMLRQKYFDEEIKSINRTSRKVPVKEAEKIKDNFIERLKKTEEESKEKKKQIELEKKRREEEQLLKSQTKQKKKQEVILKQINDMFAWNQKRKDKIRLIKSQEDLQKKEIIKDCFQPKICEKSKKIVQKNLNKSTESAFDRLYHDDEKRQQKRELLQSLYKPTFHPVVNKKRILNSVNSRAITLNDYCDMTMNCDLEELLRNKVYQNRKIKTIDMDHFGLPVLTETTPFLNNSHLSNNSREGKPTNSSSRKFIKSINFSNSKNNEALNTINAEIRDRREVEKEKTPIDKLDKAIKQEQKSKNIRTAKTPSRNSSKDKEENDNSNRLSPHSLVSNKSKDSRKSSSRSRSSYSKSKSSSRSYTSKSYSCSSRSSYSRSVSSNRSHSSDKSRRNSKSSYSSNRSKVSSSRQSKGSISKSSKSDRKSVV